MSQEQFSHAAPIFAVPNVQKAAEYYRDKLGFSIEFLWEEPPTYGVLRRGEGVSIHLSLNGEEKRRSALYVFVYDVDTLHEELQDNEVTIVLPIDDRDYRMRDFEIEDPWGNRITFGKGI